MDRNDILKSSYLFIVHIYKGNIYTDNKAAGFGDIGKTVPKNQQDYRNKNDFISLLSLTQKHKYNNLHERETKNKPTDILGNHKLQII